MTANTKARYYTWYMSDDHTARVAAYEWWPVETGATVAPDEATVEGTLTFKHRETPGDVWGPGMEVGVMALATARALATGQGFHVETGERDRPVNRPCPTCQGFGVVDYGEGEETCPDCDGTGDA